MNLYIARTSTHSCKYCDSQILEGQEVVRLFLSKRAENGNTWSKTLLFHVEYDCYEKWLHDNYVRQVLNWRENRNAPKPVRTDKTKVGRPVKATQVSVSTERNRLKTLLNYHIRKGGHANKVREIEELLSKTTP